MADIPIIFSTPMIRALLDGRKTMTRRLFKRTGEPPPGWDGKYGFSALTPARCVELRGWTEEQGPLSRFMPMRFAPKDRLWVRETCWRAYKPAETNNGYVYLADYGHRPGLIDYESARSHWKDSWKSPRHAPRVSSRLTLVVTSTKVERLHDLSEQDCAAEGIVAINRSGFRMDGFGPPGTPPEDASPSRADAYRNLWVSLHGPNSWAANPEVVAISFKVHHCNIDQMKEAA